MFLTHLSLSILFRDVGFLDIADRLIEFQYELTDSLAFYLCGRKPDHKNGQHWIIPEIADTLIDSAEVSKEARSRLIALPNHSFEELACDVYDEVNNCKTVHSFIIHLPSGSCTTWSQSNTLPVGVSPSARLLGSLLIIFS